METLFHMTSDDPAPRAAAGRPPGAGRRGPVARTPPLSPTGFRIDDDRRLRLQAAAFVKGQSSLQAVIGLAVDQFLVEMSSDPNYTKCVRAKLRARKQRDEES